MAGTQNNPRPATSSNGCGAVLCNLAITYATPSNRLSNSRILSR